MGSVLENMPGSVVENVLGGLHGRVVRVHLGASRERTREGIVKQAGSVSPSAIGIVLESSLRCVLGSIFRAYW